MVFSLLNMNNSFKKIIKTIIIAIVIFITFTFSFSAIDANMKVIQCTACDNEVLKIHWNGISYGMILGLSIILSIIPSLWIFIFKKRK
jgi:hypothetical protein